MEKLEQNFKSREIDLQLRLLNIESKEDDLTIRKVDVGKRVEDVNKREEELEERERVLENAKQSTAALLALPQPTPHQTPSATATFSIKTILLSLVLIMVLFNLRFFSKPDGVDNNNLNQIALTTHDVVGIDTTVAAIPSLLMITRIIHCPFVITTILISNNYETS